MIQRLFQLTFACRDVASDVGRGGVLSVDFSRVDVNEEACTSPLSSAKRADSQAMDGSLSEPKRWARLSDSPAVSSSPNMRWVRANPSHATLSSLSSAKAPLNAVSAASKSARSVDLSRPEDGQHGR